jgi:hypothetical protein
MIKRKLVSILLVLIMAVVLAVPFAVATNVSQIQASSQLTLRPNGAGYYAQLTPDSGSNYARVNGATEGPGSVSMTNTTYKYDTYAMTNHTSEFGTINSVTVYAKCKYVASNPAYFTARLRLNSTNSDGAVVNINTGSYSLYSKTVARPGGGNWSWTDIDNVEAGLGLNSSDPSGSAWCDWFYIVVDYTPFTTSTITLSAASSIAGTTATLNGNITATGGENPTVTVYWGTTDHPGTATGWDHNSAPTSPSQPQGVAAFYYNATGLAPGTTFYFTAKATNSAGTSWPAASLSFLTTPAAPTNVSATDGTYTDKVTITWTKSTGATAYHVFRNTTDLGALGDVATMDDSGIAGTIIAGTTAATKGTNTSHVTLNLSANGYSLTYPTYTVVASNSSGSSPASSGDVGNRSIGTITYQWQVSASDYDGIYSNITGATTVSYDYVSAPADGTGRYFECVESATGASNVASTSDRGFIGVPSGSSGGMGLIIIGRMDPSSIYTTGLDAFTVTNNGNCPIDISVSGTDMTGGNTWTLSDTATPGADTFGVKAGIFGADYTIVVKKTAPYNLISSNIAVNSNVVFGIKFYAPTSASDGVNKKGTLSCNIVIH